MNNWALVSIWISTRIGTRISTRIGTKMDTGINNRISAGIGTRISTGIGTRIDIGISSGINAGISAGISTRYSGWHSCHLVASRWPVTLSASMMTLSWIRKMTSFPANGRLTRIGFLLSLLTLMSQQVIRLIFANKDCVITVNKDNRRVQMECLWKKI